MFWLPFPHFIKIGTPWIVFPFIFSAIPHQQPSRQQRPANIYFFTHAARIWYFQHTTRQKTAKTCTGLLSCHTIVGGARSTLRDTFEAESWFTLRTTTRVWLRKTPGSIHCTTGQNLKRYVKKILRHSCKIQLFEVSNRFKTHPFMFVQASFLDLLKHTLENRLSRLRFTFLRPTRSIHHSRKMSPYIGFLAPSGTTWPPIT